MESHILYLFVFLHAVKTTDIKRMKMKRLIIGMACLAVVTTAAVADSYPYQNPNLPARERAVDLCSRLTLEEKAMLMLDESPAIPRLGIKKFFWWSEALHGAANQGNVTVFPAGG